MKDFSKLKVRVVEETVTSKRYSAPNTTPASCLVQPVRVNMIKGTIDKPKTQDSTSYELFKNTFDNLISTSISDADVAKIINLEFRKVYIQCLPHESMKYDVEAVKYLDGIIFNTIESIILSILNCPDKDKALSLARIIYNSVNNSVIVIDYQDGFDYCKMNQCISEFIEAVDKVLFD